MKQSSPLRSSDVRAHNQKMILSRIYDARKTGISQSEIVADTGLKAPTAFRIFTSLEEQGLIEIVKGKRSPEAKQGGKGRRPVTYTVNKNALYTIGLEFWASSISFGIFNFNGDRIFSRIEPLPGNITIEKVIASIVLMVNEALKSQKINRKKIAGMGLAAPGQVDLVSRQVINYPRIRGMMHIALADELEKQLKFPVTIHNNCSVIALSEYRYGGHDHQGSLFTFLLRFGVNGAFVDQRGIYTTGSGITLETGHVPVDSRGPLCSCGLKGCLESQLWALDAGKKDKQGLLFDNLEARLVAEDDEAKQITAKAADSLFVVAKSIMRFFNPSAFLILGNGEMVSRCIAENLSNKLGKEPDTFVLKPPMVFGRAYDSFISQRGASDLVLAQYFS